MSSFEKESRLQWITYSLSASVIHPTPSTANIVCALASTASLGCCSFFATIPWHTHAHAMESTGVLSQCEKPLGSVDFRDLVLGVERFDIRGVTREFATLAGFGVVCHPCAAFLAELWNEQIDGLEMTFVVLADSLEVLCLAKARVSPIIFATCLHVVRKEKKNVCGLCFQLEVLPCDSATC